MLNTIETITLWVVAVAWTGWLLFTSVAPEHFPPKVRNAGGLPAVRHDKTTED